MIFGVINPVFAENIILTFDDITSEEGNGYLPLDYAGLDWSTGLNWWKPEVSGRTSSGDYSADPYNSEITIGFGEKVTFLGSWVYQYIGSAYWEGWSDGNKIATSDSISEGLIEVSWDNVDTVKFVTTDTGFGVLDDIKYVTSLNIAPEPISSVLFVIGEIVLAGRGYLNRLEKA